MPASDVILETTPRDPSPDTGPRHRGGPFTSFVLLSCGIAGVGGALILRQRGFGPLALVGLGVIALIGLRSAWCLLERIRHHARLPRSHAVLVDALGFRIPYTCRDVAVAIFLEPDRLAAGQRTRLFCFCENYASRQRVVRLRVGPHPSLGLPEARMLELRLAAGQAAVYVLPLELAATLPEGEHDLPVTLKVRKPTGTGLRLPGVRRHIHDLWTVHFAVPFTVGAATSNTPVQSEPMEPAYLSLASIAEPTADLSRLDAYFRERSGRP